MVICHDRVNDSATVFDRGEEVMKMMMLMMLIKTNGQRGTIEN
jgi:hypothetical protein